MRVNDSSNAAQIVKIFEETAKTSQAIDVAILKKHQDVQKNAENAILQLLQSAASLTDSGSRLDTRA